MDYAAILPLKEDTDKLRQLLKADFAGQVNVTPEDIEEFKPGRHTHIYIVSIGIKPNIRRSERRTHAFRLISGLMDMIVGLGRKGVIVETMTAIGQTAEGIRLLQQFGFSEIPPPTPGKRAFTIKIKESGAPVILQYKQALAESGTDFFEQSFPSPT